ncbi:hypothetical protein OF846_004719 [Rhodotorula toruloides]|nr:hypothetical protein OF846_004719 [Rhodotorula toruloides]
MAEVTKLPGVAEESASDASAPSTLLLEQQQRAAQVKKLFRQARDGMLSLDDLEEHISALLEQVDKREMELVEENVSLASKVSSNQGLLDELEKALTKRRRQLVLLHPPSQAHR